MTDCLWLIWKQRGIRWNPSRHRTGMSCVTTQFRPFSSQRSSISQTDQDGSEKKKKREAVVSPENEWVDTTHGTAEGNFLAQHKTRNRWTWTVEQSPVQQRSSRKTRAAKSTFICSCCSKRSRLGTVFCRCGKKFVGLTAVQEDNVPVTIGKGCQTIQSPVQFRFTEQVPRGQRHGTSAGQICWAKLRFHILRCTRKCVADPIIKPKIFFEGCVDRWAKDEAHRNRENCKVKTFAWEKNSVNMQNTNNQDHSVNRYIREGWKLSTARTSFSW